MNSAFDIKLAAELLVRYHSSGGRNGRISDMQKTAFVDGVLWVQNQLSDKWIKIESEKDLPSDKNSFYWTFYGIDVIEVAQGSDIDIRYKYYMPITKPNPPKP